MPYKIAKRGGKFCVVRKDTGESKGCSSSRKGALAHMAALYAHEPKAAEGMELHHLEAKTGKHRYETLNGKKFLVVPVLALKQEVIHAVNAKMPEFVPIDSLKVAAQSWNGRPCVVHHPTDEDGDQISANSPAVMEERAFGTIYYSHVNGENLGMEAWVDEERLQQLGEHEMLEDLQNDVPVGVSVGAYVRTEPRMGAYKGNQYKAVWRQVNGDHLAFLPRGVGACSLDMGCGTARAAGGPGSGPHKGGAAAHDASKEAHAASAIANKSGRKDDHAAAAEAHKDAANKHFAAADMQQGASKSQSEEHFGKAIEHFKQAMDHSRKSGNMRAAEQFQERINSMAEAFRAARNIPQSERDKMNDADFAGKGTSFPIKKAGDVEAAAKSIGRAGSDNYSPARIKRNIIRIAKRKGFTSELPEAWKKESNIKAAGGPGSGPGGHAAKAKASSDKAKAAEAKGDHSAAAAHHTAAAEAHGKAADAHMAKGNRTAAKAHETAAAHHNDAAASHGAAHEGHGDPSVASSDTKDASRSTERAGKFRGAEKNDAHAKAADHAEKAAEAAQDGDHEKAADHHEKAAEHHTAIAEQLAKDGDAKGSNAHYDAAKEHSDAADAHSQLAKEEEDDKEENKKEEKQGKGPKAAAKKPDTEQDEEVEDDEEDEDEDSEADEEREKDVATAVNQSEDAVESTTYANSYRMAEEGDDDEEGGEDEEDAADPAEFVDYKTVDLLLTQADEHITEACALAKELMKNEGEDADAPDGSEEHEEMEDANMRAVTVHAMAAINALYQVQNLCYASIRENKEENGEIPRYAAGARHSAADRNMIQEVHDHSVKLGADCPGDMKSAARGNCGCGGHAAEGAKMKREERIAALSKNEHSPIKDEKVLKTFTDDQLTALEQNAEKLKTLSAAPKELTEEQFMKAAPAKLKSLVDRATKRENDRKEYLVGQLKTAAAGIYTEDDLKKMDLETLERTAKLAKIAEADDDTTDFSGVRPVPRAAGSDDVKANPPDGYKIALEKRRGVNNTAAAAAK